MNIVYVYGRKWPSAKAGLSFSTYTCYGIAKSNPENQVDLIVLKNTDSSYEKVLEDYFSLEPLPNFKVHLIETLKTTSFYVKAFKKIRSLAKAHRIDAILTRTTNFLPYLYFLKLFNRIKIFYEPHSFFLDPSIKEKEIHRKKEYWYQKLFLPRVNGLICHQSIIRDLYQKYLPKQNFAVITYGLSKVVKNDNLFSNQYLGYIGSLYDNKGVDDLFYALKEVEDRSLKLLIVGGRPNEVDHYLNLAKKLDISDRVKITGWVACSEIDKYLNMIKIGFVPLKDCFHSRYLTCPTKVFDYFSHGIPVIGSDLPTIKEVVTNKCGLFYQTGDLQSLIAAINQLNSSAELYNQFSNNVIEKAEELLFEKRGARIIEFMEKC